MKLSRNKLSVDTEKKKKKCNTLFSKQPRDFCHIALEGCSYYYIENRAWDAASNAEKGSDVFWNFKEWDSLDLGLLPLRMQDY